MQIATPAAVSAINQAAFEIALRLDEMIEETVSFMRRQRTTVAKLMRSGQLSDHEKERAGQFIEIIDSFLRQATKLQA